MVKWIITGLDLILPNGQDFLWQEMQWFLSKSIVRNEQFLAETGSEHWKLAKNFTNHDHIHDCGTLQMVIKVSWLPGAQNANM